MTWVHAAFAALLSAMGCYCSEANSYNITTTNAASIPRIEAIECGNTYSSMNITGYRITNDGVACQELPFSWLFNKVYEAGYVYFVKSRSSKEFNPPLLTYENSSNSAHYWSLLPCKIRPGSGLELRYSLPRKENGVYMILGDSAQSNDAMLRATYLNNMTKLTFETIVGGVVVESQEEITYYELEVDVEVKFTMHIDSYYRVLFKVNDITFHVYELSVQLGLEALRDIKIGAMPDSEVNIYNVGVYNYSDE